jgi:predicted dehydrogenase
MPNEMKIGMIGLDTSHVVAFTQLLNDPKNEHHIPGGKVVIAYPGGSPDFDLSINRVQGFTNELKDKWGVKIVETPEVVAEGCDLLFIESVDGRVHLDQFRRTVKYKKPTYIDKPLTVDPREAEEIFRLANENGVPVMSTSSLRYLDVFEQALESIGRDKVTGVDAFGPMGEVPTQPGLYWYGIHTVEMIVAAMGPGCREARAFKNEGTDIVLFVYDDGRVATFRGLRKAHSKFGAVIHGPEKGGAAYADASLSKVPGYASLIRAIMRSLPNGKSDIPQEQTLAVIKMIDAANKARDTGKTVNI